MALIHTFDENNFIEICDYLTKNDTDLKLIIATYGYPPLWKRSPSFETLIHIILEQQVSLSSARSALNKLKEQVGQVTPESILLLTDEQLRNCYFSRQKSSYVRHLAQAVISNQLSIESFNAATDEYVRTALKKIKGIGDWSANVYLMMAMQRADLFPLNDVALVKSLQETKNLPRFISKEEISVIAAKWKPYQTIAAFILWHSYLCKRKRVVSAHI